MPEKKMAEGFGLMFRPESWTSLEAFSTILGPPYENTRGLQKGIISVHHHLQKFDVFGTLANRLREHLAEDQKELEEHGRTPALRSKEFSALIETLFCELYSTLDGVRTTLHAIYHKVRGVQKKSTEKMFKAAQDNAYGPEFPEPFLKAMQSGMPCS